LSPVALYQAARPRAWPAMLAPQLCANTCLCMQLPASLSLRQRRESAQRTLAPAGKAPASHLPGRRLAAHRTVRSAGLRSRAAAIGSPARAYPLEGARGSGRTARACSACWRLRTRPTAPCSPGWRLAAAPRRRSRRSSRTARPRRTAARRARGSATVTAGRAVSGNLAGGQRRQRPPRAATLPAVRRAAGVAGAEWGWALGHPVGALRGMAAPRAQRRVARRSQGVREGPAGLAQSPWAHAAILRGPAWCGKVLQACLVAGATNWVWCGSGPWERGAGAAVMAGHLDQRAPAVWQTLARWAPASVKLEWVHR